MDPFEEYYKVGEGVSYLLEEEMWNAEYSEAMEWYDKKLKPLLEPEHNGSFVAFHWHTGDYALGLTGKEAGRILAEATGHPPYALTVTGVGLPPGHRWIQEYPTFGEPVTGLGHLRLKPKQPERVNHPVRKRTVRRKPHGDRRDDK